MNASAPPRKILGRVLAALRKRAELSQVDLCALIGVQQASWSRLESGLMSCTFDHLTAASRALKHQPSEILALAEQVTKALQGLGVVVSESESGLEVSPKVVDKRVEAALEPSPTGADHQHPGGATSRVAPEANHVRVPPPTPPVLAERYDHSGGAPPLATIRKDADLTQQQAAALVGQSRALWSAWEMNERPITVVQLQRVAEAFVLMPGDVARILAHGKPAKLDDLKATHLLALSSLTPTASFDPIAYLTQAWKLPTSDPT